MIKSGKPSARSRHFAWFGIILLAAFCVGWRKGRINDAIITGQWRNLTAQIISPSSVNSFSKAKAVLDKVLGFPDGYNRQRMLLDWTAKLDAQTTQDLLEYLVTQPLTAEKREPLNCLAYRWAELDFDSALQWCKNHPDKEVQEYSLPGMFDAYAAKDPAIALETLANLSDMSNGVAMSEATVVHSYAQEDPRGALAALQALPVDAPNRSGLQKFAFSIFKNWAETDPAAAAQEAYTLPDGTLQLMSWESVSKAWALQDPVAALAWTDTLPQGQSKDFAMTSAIRGISEIDAQTAATYALRLPDGNNRNALLQNIAANWSFQDPVMLLNWAGANLKGGEYNSATLTALNALANTDPQSVASYLAGPVDTAISNKAAPALAMAWARQDTSAALAWALAMPANNISLRNATVANVFSGWASTDPSTAAAYIQQNLASDEAFSKATAQVAGIWAKSDPAAAVDWAGSLPSGQQNPAIIAVLSQWTKTDPIQAGNAAQNALSHLSNLTLEQQTALRKIAISRH